MSERTVIRVSCGHSHSGTIVSGYNKNDLYMWGSTVSGKCGLGSIVNKEECYCSIPTKVNVVNCSHTNYSSIKLSIH